VIKGVDDTLLTPYESEIISFMNNFLLFEIKELMVLEIDHHSLVLYLRKCFCAFVSLVLLFEVVLLTCTPSVPNYMS
jgi:hypothetical protein